MDRHFRPSKVLSLIALSQIPATLAWPAYQRAPAAGVDLARRDVTTPCVTGAPQVHTSQTVYLGDAGDVEVSYTTWTDVTCPTSGAAVIYPVSTDPEGHTVYITEVNGVGVPYYSDPYITATYSYAGGIPSATATTSSPQTATGSGSNAPGNGAQPQSTASGSVSGSTATAGPDGVSYSSSTGTSSATASQSVSSPASLKVSTYTNGGSVYVTTYTTTFSTLTTETLTSVPDSALLNLTTSAVQTATSLINATATGSVITSITTAASMPFVTSTFANSTTLSLVNTSSLSNVQPTLTSAVTSLVATNIFVAIETDAPPAQISSRSDSPIARLNIATQENRLETNKFYANFYLGSQTSGTWTHPYSVAWSKGSGETDSWGLAVSHIERSQLVGPGTKQSYDAGEWNYFQSPVGIQSLVLSAVELGNATTLSTDSLEGFSVNVNLTPEGASSPVIKFPLTQGMAFVTGLYSDGTPLIQSGVGLLELTYVGAVVGNTTYKYRAKLENGYTWLIYVSTNDASYDENSFTLLTSGAVQGPSGFNGYIQVAKIPANSTDAESIYDTSAGIYATSATISGSVTGTTGSYTLSWATAGISTQTLLMFALPHHISSFSSATAGGVTDVQLVTTTKGYGTAVKGDSWTLTEPSLPIDMGFSPWSPELGSVSTVSEGAREAINTAGLSELSQNIASQANTGSLYYDGKALAKFAAIIYAVHDIGDNATLALSGLALLESAFATHVNNSMTYPLVYDSAWGGAVSIASYLDGGNSGDDFGNTYYNDHHFHYGYFVYTAAVIGYLDPDWLEAGTNKAWVNMLVRDYANAIPDDPYFPFQRMFDWYHGHSWAHGLIETADGKDQESSSEDTMASYGMKMWGQIIGDVNMEARGNLMLAVQARSLQDYYLYTDDNTVEPSEFIGNKAAGILFENKIQHVTYFGTNDEYIEGIHMLPLLPFSTLSRTQTFVQQEWDTYFADGALDPADGVAGGWRGILYANYAIIDAASSYAFFSNATGEFSTAYLDGGASQTWYLAWSAALGGSSA